MRKCCFKRNLGSSRCHLGQQQQAPVVQSPPARTSSAPPEQSNLLQSSKLPAFIPDKSTGGGRPQGAPVPGHGNQRYNPAAGAQNQGRPVYPNQYFNRPNFNPQQTGQYVPAVGVTPPYYSPVQPYYQGQPFKAPYGSQPQYSVRTEVFFSFVSFLFCVMRKYELPLFLNLSGFRFGASCIILITTLL